MNERELATVLAALRYWQRNIIPSRVDSDIHDMATGNQRLEPLSDDEIDELCEQLNAARPVPRVLVVVEGGVVNAVLADQPLDVDVLDHDNWEVIDRELEPEEWHRFDAMLKEIEVGKLLDQVY